MVIGYLTPFCRFDAKNLTTQTYSLRGQFLRTKTPNRCKIADNLRSGRYNFLNNNIINRRIFKNCFIHVHDFDHITKSRNFIRQSVYVFDGKKVDQVLFIFQKISVSCSKSTYLIEIYYACLRAEYRARFVVFKWMFSGRT